MKTVLKGHTLEDAVRQIMQLFFDIESDIEAESVLRQEGNDYTSEARITFNNKTVRKSYTQTLCSPERKAVSDIVKKSVFLACRELSDMPAPWGISTGIRPAKTARRMIEQGCGDDDILSELTGNMWINDKKASLCLEVAHRENKLICDNPKNIGVYVGIPFCPTRCAYCSFISQAVSYNSKFVEPYVDSLIKEIEYTANISEELGFIPETVYFGGGTPTAIPYPLLEKLIIAVRKSFGADASTEFTVEAGRPDTFSPEMLAMLDGNGVGRISINPQTMNNKTLKLIGRNHTVEQTLQAFEMASKFNFSINADVIAGLPEESEEDFERTINGVCDLKPQSVTVHTMYLKRAARLIGQFEKYRFVKDTGAMVDYSYNYLKKKGYNPYYMYKQRNTLGNLENTAYSYDGHECLYNIYIMEEIRPILALGAGSSTKMVKGDRIERIFNPKDAADYIKRIDEICEKKNALLDYYGVSGFCH